MAPSRFISLEGGEGSGKSTQAALLAEWLRTSGREVVATREPGGTPGAEEIRALLVRGEPGRWEPMTEALLHYAARRDHVSKVVLPALRRGAWVVCDRFIDSTLAYQGYGHGLGAGAIQLLRDVVLQDFAPGTTFLLDIPVEAGLARAGRRHSAEARYERMGRDFHARVRDGFHAIAAAEPDRVLVINAASPVDEVAKALRAAVRQRYPDAPEAP